MYGAQAAGTPYNRHPNLNWKLLNIIRTLYPFVLYSVWSTLPVVEYNVCLIYHVYSEAH